MIYFGLDLGQAQDYTALTALEKKLIKTDIKRDYLEVLPDITVAGSGKEYHLRHVERFPLGTTYPAIVSKLQDRIDAINLGEKYMVVVDATGVGRPVVDLMRKNNIRCTPVSFTAGEKEAFDEVFGGWRVPKRILVSNLQVLFQNGQLKMAAGMEHIDLITKELLNLKVKVTAAKNDTYEAWREGDHDDLVFSLAMCAWYAVRFGITEEEENQPMIDSPWVKVKGL